MANSPWERFAIHAKWFLIKSYRPFNSDEKLAFFSWFIISHIIWVILGTTTFFSLLFCGLNSLFAKELVGQATGKFISRLSPGFDIQFGDAVVPEWKKGMISFKKVVIKTVDNVNGKENSLKLDLRIDSLKLTLSFSKWKDLRGLIQNVEIEGMRGSVDRTNHDSDKPEIDFVENRFYEIASLKIRDSKIKIHKDGEPLNVSIYDCEIPGIRMNWMFLDFWNAASITGSVNGSLFTIHKRKHQLAYVNGTAEDTMPWKRITRFQLDQINIDALGLKDTHFNWLFDGKVEVTADILPPEVKSDNVPYSSRYVVIDFKFKFSDLMATVPSELPTLSNGEAIISFEQLRPLIAYINDKRLKRGMGSKLEPVSFRVVKRLSDLENVLTLKESKMLDSIATEIYLDLLKNYHEDQMSLKTQRMNSWSKAVASQLFIVGLSAMA